MSDRLFPVSIHEQIRCVERELKMRGRVYPDRVERNRMSPQQAERETEAMTAVLGTLMVCMQLADCLDQAPRQTLGGLREQDRVACGEAESVFKVIQISDELARQVAAQLRGEDVSSGPRPGAPLL